MSIELRLSDVDPPAPDPPRTIYRDVLDLPDPVLLGITIRYFNYDGVGLYFQITASGTGYTFGTVNLGLLGAGANRYENLDDFGSRAKPVVGDFTLGEFEESVTLILRAYTDAGYTDLKWTHERTVTVYWIKSDDAAWTLDEDDDFDDGTVMGWAVANETGNDGGYPTIAVATDFVLSAPYSCKITQKASAEGVEFRARLYKSFTTADRPKVFAIINLRSAVNSAFVRIKNVQVQRDGTVLVFLGRPYDGENEDYLVMDKWMRIVVLLPRNTTLDVRLVQSFHARSFGAYLGYLWLDDFKIISK